MINMHRKTTFAIIAALLLILAVIASGCARADEPSPQAGDQDEPKAEANLLEKVKQAGTLKVGMMGTYPPYNFLNENKEMDGFDADIAKEIAKRLGVKAEFVAQEWSGMIAGLQAEKFDTVISQMTITDERKEQMDFTEGYITNEVKIIVKDDNTTITALEDFKGKKIGVGLGTNDETYLRTKVLPEVGDFEIKTYDDVYTSLADLNAGRIDATINNIYALKPLIDKGKFKIKAVGEPIKADQAGIAVRKGNPEFLQALDGALKDMKQDGTYDSIFQKWFGEKPKS